MKKIAPYISVDDAMSKLDNGGRFYNILTKADDGVISPAELAKVGGVFNDKQKMVLFLDLALSRLDSREKDLVISRLEDPLQVTYHQYKAQELLPSEAHERGVLASNVIISGTPRFMESKSNFSGFIMVPIMVGKVMTFAMIPLIDQYDVYELRDEASSESFLIAHAKGSEKFPNRHVTVAGVLKELKADKKEKVASKKFLEVVYRLGL